MDRTFGVAVLLLVGVATAVRTPGDEKGLFARTHAKGLVAAKAESLPPALLQSNEREAGELEDDGGWGSTFTNFLGKGVGVLLAKVVPLLACLREREEG